MCVLLLLQEEANSQHANTQPARNLHAACTAHQHCYVKANAVKVAKNHTSLMKTKTLLLGNLAVLRAMCANVVIWFREKQTFI